MDAGATPPATDRPSAHALFLEAGGDTPEYDADRYVGLLRDHGYAQPRVGLTEIIGTVLLRELAEEVDGIPTEPVDDGALAERAALIARLLTDELGKHGFRIHDVARCIRPPGDPLAIGRPMTPEEQATLLPDGDAAPPPGARPRSSGPTFEHVTPEGDRFLVPEGWTPGEKSSRCRSCGALILWAVTPRSKRAPVNVDGTSHFSDCPDAPAWRKRDA